ncbi:hypothetical protein GCM10008960_37730 [Deinococcus sedimenti]|uniref:Uncharacterized protein n=1 Tax=Deinococcus sedimenti TaxID=1867090 RepID=A0ABQ2SBP4_9DEIO|nr:hypothetical protein GCM10008960_37730 [Deinococcus sedimenti]
MGGDVSGFDAILRHPLRPARCAHDGQWQSAVTRCGGTLRAAERLFSLRQKQGVRLPFKWSCQRS